CLAAEAERRLDLRSHRPLRQFGQECCSRCSVELPQLALVGLAETLVDGGNLREDEQTRRTEPACQQGGCTVLVDHDVDACQPVAAANDRDSAAAARDRERARVRERANRFELDDLEWFGRRNNAPMP